MEDQKIEPLLNLALDATGEELEKSEILANGYDRAERTWQVIVRYHGDLQQVLRENWEAVVLSGGYAIITLPQDDVDVLAKISEIEYVEKPKRLYFSVDQGRAASCISAVQVPENLDPPLLGNGVIVAVIDSGVDYFHPDFRNDDGTTRILAMWDQTEQGAGFMPPEGFGQGAEYTMTEINEALNAGSRQAGLYVVPEQDFTGHGTQVLGIAAGNGRASGGRYRGVAPESPVIVVKLGTPSAEGFPRTTELMMALEYVYRKAEAFGMPVVVNLSFGNVYGSHRGNSLLETYMDLMAGQGRSVICVGTGNEGSADGHFQGKLTDNTIETVELLVDQNETSLNVQVWKNYVDEFEISVMHPDGRIIGPFSRELGTARYRLGNQTLLVYYGEPSPYQENQEIFIDFIPENRYIDSGVWRIMFTPQKIVDGQFNLWLIDAKARGSGTRFLQASPEMTLTIPSAAAKVIAVGAYDSRRNAYASFSGRGWPAQNFGVKPDLVAPGVDITTTAVGGGYTTVSGTSFATPFVTGSAVLLMQWGIVDGNDPYLYGEKVRAYLRRGAKPLPGFTEYPNNEVGYGALCMRESLSI